MDIGADAKAPRFPEGRRHRRKFSLAGPASVQSSLQAYSTANVKCKQLSETCVAENDAHSFVEIRDGKIGRFAQGFFIIAFDEDRATTCGARTIDIAPAIAYDITSFGINVQLGCCAQDQAWSRLAATARLAVTLAGVIANLNTIK